MDEIDSMDYSLPSQPSLPVYLDSAVTKGFKRIYPIYLDAAKSTRQGRRINKSLAVKDPCIVYMAECVKSFGFESAVEPSKRLY